VYCPVSTGAAVAAVRLADSRRGAPAGSRGGAGGRPGAGGGCAHSGGQRHHTQLCCRRGCVLTCLNMAAETVMTETATRAVRIISLSNGNSEFRMDNGNAGINVILVLA
jgi:hypothetical protein